MGGKLIKMDNWDDEDISEEDAVIDSVSKIRVFLQIVGVLVLLIALCVFAYFQYEEMEMNKAKIPNITSIYNGTCENEICNYGMVNEIPKSVKCFYKGDKKDCSSISFKFDVKGNKTCHSGLCNLRTVEVISNCQLDGWSIDCDQIEVNQSG